MSIMSLDEYRELFKDEVAYKRFVEQFRKKALESSGTAIYDNDELIGGVVSKDQVRANLYDKILRRIAGRPEILDELLARSNEEIVDIDGKPVK